MYARQNKPTEAKRQNMHIRTGDTVEVLSGKDKGKRGRVLRVSPLKGTAIVERVNFLKKHERPNPQKNSQGGIVDREAPIRVDKLMLVCPSCGEPSRTGSHRTADGGTRFCKKCKAEVTK